MYYTEKGFTFEGGQGTTYRLQENLINSNLKAVSFETGGRGLNLGTPKVVTNIPGMKITKELTDFSSSLGRGYIKPLAQADYTITKGVIGGNFRLDAIGKMGEATQPKTTFNFFGIGKEEKGFLNILGGKPTKMRYDIVKNVYTISGKPNILAKIKVITPKDLMGGFNGGGGQILKSVTKQKYTGSYAESLLRTSAKSMVTIPKTSVISKVSPAFTTQFKQVTITKTEPRQVTKQTQFPKSITLQMPKMIEETITRTKQRNFYMPKTMEITRLEIGRAHV